MHPPWRSVVVMALALVAGCAPPAAAAGRPSAGVVYVANMRDGTISRLDGATGRVLGPPLPAGRAPWQLAAGPGGRLLVLALAGEAVLTHVAPAGGPGPGWAARPVPLEAHASGASLADDGRGHAALAYRVAAPPATSAAPPLAAPCRVAVLDVATGAVEATHAPCGPRELILSLAVGDGPGGPTAYLGIWRVALRGAGAEVPAGGHLRALDLATGAVVGEVPLTGVPMQLVVARAPGAAGHRVYCVEGSHSADPAGTDALDFLADQWLLRGLDPLTLAPESAFALAARPRALAVAADGDHAYALADAGGPGSWSRLVRIDLRSGGVRPVRRVPGTGAGGLVVAGDRLYVPDPEGDSVTAVDRHHGELLPPAATSRAPAGIVLAGR
jgi:hypothetical protein